MTKKNLGFTALAALLVGSLAWTPAPVEYDTEALHLADDCGMYISCGFGLGKQPGGSSLREDHRLLGYQLGSGPVTSKHNECLLCAVGTCQHENCNPMEQDMEDFAAAIEIGDLETSARLYADLVANGQIQYVADADAVEVKNCEGRFESMILLNGVNATDLLTLAAEL